MALRDTKRERQEKPTEERVRVWGRAAWVGERGRAEDLVGETVSWQKNRGSKQSPNRNKLRRSGFAREYQHLLGHIRLQPQIIVPGLPVAPRYNEAHCEEFLL